MARFQSPSLPGLPPLHGGLVGYLGYDVVREVERLPGVPSDDLGHPDAALVVIGQFCAFDHWRQRIVLIDNVVVPVLSDGPDAEADPAEAVRLAYEAACARLVELAADCARPADGARRPADGGRAACGAAQGGGGADGQRGGLQGGDRRGQGVHPGR